MHKIFYKMNGNGCPVPCSFNELVEWQDSLHKDMKTGLGCSIARTYIPVQSQNVMISTIFFPQDHSFGYGNKPVLWETMVFDYPDVDCNRLQFRTTSIDNALKQHQHCVECVLNRDVERMSLITEEL